MENTQYVCLQYYSPTPTSTHLFPASNTLISQEKKVSMKSWNFSNDILKDKEKCQYKVIYCYRTNYFKIQWFQITQVYHLRVSVGQKFASS